MKKSIKTAEARRILRKAPSQFSFWLCTNEMIRSLAQLEKALEKVDDDVFRYHVTREKNDFEKWIREIINDKELAREIARIKTRETLVRKIIERLEELRGVLRSGVKRAGKRSKAKRIKRKKARIRAKSRKARKRRR